MKEKKKLGRPPGPRKDGRSIRLVLASDCLAIAGSLRPQYGSTTAAIEALIRVAAERMRELGISA